MSAGKTRTTSIVATVGPSMRTADQLTGAIRAGARGFRIPLARQSPGAVDLSHLISVLAADLDVDVSIYLDVPGPKKILVVPSDRTAGTSIDFRVPIVQRSGLVGPHPEGIHLLCDAPSGYFEVGDTVLLGDGEVALSVVEFSGDSLVLRPPVGGIDAGQFGVAIPGKEGHHVGSPLLNSQTTDIIRHVPHANVLLSFVERQEQIDEARGILTGYGKKSDERTQVWAKIETRAGVENLGAIAQVTEGVLLGRGDLLIDTGYLDYYLYERRVRELLLGGATPLMIGTQLWTASSATWLPHRSELSYICDWIAGGVHSLLLSDETTIGTDPVRTITTIYALTERYATS